MTDLHKIPQQSLEALEDLRVWRAKQSMDVTALRTALAQQDEPVEPVREPVAWIHTDLDKPRVKFLEWSEDEPGYRGRWIKTPLYAAPPRCPNCASLEAQNTELDRRLTELEQPVQEPVAWYQKRGQEVLTSHPACWGREDEPWTPLYTAPPPPQRKPLTEEEIDRICASLGFAAISPAEIVRAVERTHGIGEQP